MTKTLSLSLAALVVAGATLPAQGMISAGNVDYTFSDIPDSTTSNLGNARFTAARNAQPTVLFGHWWYYRVQGDAFETPFNNGDTNNDGTNTQGFNETYNGGQALLIWTNVDERGLMTAAWKMTLYSTGPGRGFAVSQMTVTNTSGAPLVIDTFTYADFDVCSNQNAAVGQDGNSRHRITHATNCTVSEFLGINMDHYEVQAWPMLRDAFIDSNLTNLQDLGLPWTTADYTAAFQWQNRQILPGQSATFTALLTYRHHPCLTQASSTVYGSGSNGSNGVPTLTTVNEPIIGIVQPQGFDVLPKMAVRNAVPNAAGSINVGVGRTNNVLANVTLLTNPLGSIPFNADANGGFDLPLQIPNDNSLCALTLDFQALLLDAGQSPFPVSHSAGLEWVLGGYRKE